jgi:hypothetical protein
MLSHGYANMLLAVWSIVASFKAVWDWSPFCRIVGNADPSMPSVVLDVGNETAADCRSAALANSMSDECSVWFCIITGNPQDIGTRLATAVEVSIAIVRTAKANVIIFLTISSTLLLIMDIYGVD